MPVKSSWTDLSLVWFAGATPDCCFPRKHRQYAPKTRFSKPTFSGQLNLTAPTASGSNIQSRFYMILLFCRDISLSSKLLHATSLVWGLNALKIAITLYNPQPNWLSKVVAVFVCFQKILWLQVHLGLQGGINFAEMTLTMTVVDQARKKSTKIKFLGPETARWGGGLPREGVVAENFVPALETLSSLGFEERNPGCPGNFTGMSRTPGGVQKVCAKKLRAHFSFPSWSVRHLDWNLLVLTVPFFKKHYYTHEAMI